MEEKEQRTDVNNTDNLPLYYTLDDIGLGTGKIRPQEDSIRLLKVPTQTMDGRSAQKVNNLSADICIDRGEGAENRQQQYRKLTKIIHPR